MCQTRDRVSFAECRYPSSKTCHQCGHFHKDLKLSDRTFVCLDCGYTEDRDLNAAQNLRDTTADTVLDLQTTMF
ncbi:zinc ribbon domain-containing protein [Ileibacterium valens]|uniref:zinc ribbon domain-containing protein n=1 Tax=Ileibacterium valens TaxID=1862668 RepID=UPI003D2ECFF7